MDGHSPEITKQLFEQLKNLVPEAFADGRLHVEALKRALGEEHVLEKNERYHLDWPGKSAAYKLLQAPSSATLRPQPDLSVNFDTAEHVFIEGENLEVLKVLQKAYFGKVKLIYIDPPYNTGSDSFIYPDRFQESKADYLKRINELDDDGQLMREGFFRKNNKENGHYHSNWLNMMLPRLYLARNLLREDGVIFVSIDDNEVHNLRCVMNEVFGEENFIATIIWQKVYSPKNTARHFSEDHDYILIYARNAENWMPNLLSRTEEMEARYANPDNDPRGPWKPGDISARNYYGAGTYPITCPSGRIINGPPSGRYWVISKARFDSLNMDNRIWWGVNGSNVPSIKRFISEVKQGLVPQTLWTYDEVGHTQEAKKELVSLIDFTNSDVVFNTPKPTRLIKRILQLTTSPGTHQKDGDDVDTYKVCEESGSFSNGGIKAKSTRLIPPPPEIVMDFFAGSATTAQAVLETNMEDGGNRKVVCVQLPEVVSENLTIADIARERIRRVIQKIHDEADLASPAPDNLGFKSFVLAPSNFKQWRGDDIETAEQLAEQLELFVQSEKDGADVGDILYELLLKAGFPLTTPLERLSIPTLEHGNENAPVWRVNNGELLFVLETFNLAMIAPLLTLAPKEIICLDSVFQGSDELKTNLDLQCRDARIRFTCV